ncbi:MAG: cytochrome b5 domain-containing protein, partial [Anaerolineales bacterium]
RYSRYPETCHFVRLKRVDTLSETERAPVRRVVLDTHGTGLRYEPGDRCAILPENSPQLVAQTLSALRATGDEPIPLTAAWRTALQLRDGYQQARVLSLRTLLTFGRIRPVARLAAKTLQALTHSQPLHRILEARAEDQWELWDLLLLLAERGFNPRRLWKAAPGEREHIARLVAPEVFRMYSISSVLGLDPPDELHLTIGGLRYRTAETEVSRAEARRGTSSSFLGELCDFPASASRRLSIKIVHPPRFRLPLDPSRPLVAFAGGTGIAPFRGLLQARAAQPAGGENWLFYSARTQPELYYLDEWQQLAAADQLQFRAALSQEDTRLSFDSRQFITEPSPRRRLDELMLDPENAARLWELVQAGANFYVCGRTGFARSVLDAMQAVLARDLGAEAGRQRFYQLVGEDHYLQEIFTTYPGPQTEQRRLHDASQIVLHNNPGDGYWLVINGRVYDVSQFAHMHAGGLKIIQSYAGMDATIAYRRVQHDVNPEVDSFTGMFEIGAVRRLDFGAGWGTAITPEGLRFVSLDELYRTWIRFLYGVVEMENALLNDYSIRAEQVTYDEARGAARPSLYRAQLLLQTHERFLRDYLSKSTGPALDQLWSLTSGLCSEREAYGRLRQAINTVESSPAARQVRALGPQQLAGLNRQPPTAAALARYEQLTNLLAEEDRRFLNEMKQALRSGVQVFEAHQHQTLVHGRHQLLAALTTLPAVLTDNYDRVARQLAELAP